MDSDAYHLEELRIAADRTDPRHIMPEIPPECTSILDIGCGAGQTLIGSNLAEDVHAVGIDIDRAALRLGRSITRQIDFVCGIGETLPFRSMSFDVVVSRVAVPYMHLARALPEMERVLRPGGHLWLALHPLSLTLRDLKARLLARKPRAVAHGLYVLVNGARLHFTGKELAFPFRPGRYESFQTHRSITRSLERAGFTAIRIGKGKAFVATAKRAS